MIVYHYVNLAPWEEQEIPNLPNLVIDNQDTHSGKWQGLIKIVSRLQEGFEIHIRSLVDIHQGKIGPFFKWMESNPNIANRIVGMQGEPLHALIARYTRESTRYQTKLSKLKGLPPGRPPKAKFISQRQALEALRDHRTGLEAARALGVCYVLLYLIAKGQRGIPTPMKELERDGLEKFIPSKENPRKSKKVVVG